MRWYKMMGKDAKEWTFGIVRIVDHDRGGTRVQIADDQHVDIMGVGSHMIGQGVWIRLDKTFSGMTVGDTPAQDGRWCVENDRLTDAEKRQLCTPVGMAW